MPLIAIGHVKASAGVTTTAVGIAASWPHQLAPTVVECDPAGGDIAAGFELSLIPGLAELAARHRGVNPFADADGLAGCTQTVEVWGRDVDVVCAPVDPRQVGACLPIVAQTGRLALRPAVKTVIADVGRLDETSPAVGVCEAADTVVIVLPGTASAVAHFRCHTGWLRERFRQKLRLVVIDGEYRARSVTAELFACGVDIPVIGRLSFDRRSAATLLGCARSGWSGLGRSRFRRGLSVLARELKSSMVTDVDEPTLPRARAKASIPVSASHNKPKIAIATDVAQGVGS